MGEPEISVGKSNGSCHSDWEASENNGLRFEGDVIFPVFLVDLPIRMKFSGFLLSPLGAQKRDLGAASQTLLTEVKLCTSLEWK